MAKKGKQKYVPQDAFDTKPNSRMLFRQSAPPAGTGTPAADTEIESDGTEYAIDSTLVCPLCQKTVKVSFGGRRNLVGQHQNSKACQKDAGNLAKGEKKVFKPITDFFKSKPVLVPSTVSAPPRVKVTRPSPVFLDSESTISALPDSAGVTDHT